MRLYFLFSQTYTKRYFHLNISVLTFHSSDCFPFDLTLGFHVSPQDDFLTSYGHVLTYIDHKIKIKKPFLISKKLKTIIYSINKKINKQTNQEKPSRSYFSPKNHQVIFTPQKIKKSLENLKIKFL